jgi:hypothetical protein
MKPNAPPLFSPVLSVQFARIKNKSLALKAPMKKRGFSRNASSVSLYPRNKSKPRKLSPSFPTDVIHKGRMPM